MTSGVSSKRLCDWWVCEPGKSAIRHSSIHLIPKWPPFWNKVYTFDELEEREVEIETPVTTRRFFQIPNLTL